MKAGVFAVAIIGEQLIAVQAAGKPFKAPKGLDVHGFSIGKGHPAKRLQS